MNDTITFDGISIEEGWIEGGAGTNRERRNLLIDLRQCASELLSLHCSHRIHHHHHLPQQHSKAVHVHLRVTWPQ